jgi:alginate O-acetyltransferase complex protein AlgI
VLFSSIEFLWLFMPIVLVLYLVAPLRWRNALLAAASLGFYVWGAGALLYLFLASIALNFVAGRFIGAAKDAGDEPRAARRTALVVAANLLILGLWKYAVFAVEQLDSVVGLFGGEIRKPSIALPIGISFFTFHGISYVVDIHRGRARSMRSPLDYVQYMAFFPQLIAGPMSATTRSTTRSARRRGRSASTTSPTASCASPSVSARRCSSPTRPGRSRTPPSRPATET